MGDDALEDDLAKVHLVLNIRGEGGQEIKGKTDFYLKTKAFDVFIFNTTKDYLCYIEAVALMYEESILKKCEFINDFKRV